ncbi:MAG: DNA internalization-related competence protein ComEC/Rec2 [Candidatus Sericytochromatia bacterium]
MNPQALRWVGAWVCGLALADRVPFGWVVGCAVGLGLLLYMLLSRLQRYPRWPDFVGLVLVFVVGSVWAGVRQPQPGAADPLHWAQPAPQKWVGRVLSDWQPTGVGRWRVDVAAEQLRAQAVVGKVRVHLRSDTLPAGQIGDRVAVVGRVGPAAEALNFGAFSYRDYLKRQGIFAVCNARSVHLLQTGSAWLPQRLLQRVRQDLLRRFETHLELGPARLLGSLIMGEAASPLPEEIKALFQQAGLQHVLAVSGFQVQLVVLALLGLCQWGGLSRPLTLAICLFSLWTFVALTGFPASVMRAGAVASLGLFGYLRFRQLDPLAGLIYGCAALLVWQPLLLQDIGFQFSFLATLGLISTVPWLLEHMKALPLPVSAICAPILAAQLWVLPAQLHHFGTLSWLFLPANLFAGLLTTALTWLAIAGALCGWLLPWVQGWLLAPAGVLAECLMAGVRSLLLLPQPVWVVPPLLLSLTCLVYAALCVFPFGTGLSPVWIKRLVPAGMASLLLIPGGLHLQTQRECPVRVTFLHVGQGDAVLIESGGQVALLDAGPRWRTEEGFADAGQRDILPYLQRRGIRRIDLAMISHGHLDHYGGFVSLFEAMPVGRLVTVAGAGDSDSYTALLRQIQARQIPFQVATSGTVEQFGAARLVFWQPLPQAQDDNLNDQSLVVQLIHGQVRMLFSGDLEAEGEAALLATPGFEPRHTLLKVPHHGSKTSSTPQLLAAVQPSEAVISVGEHNRFGHPAPAVLERYAHQGTRTWRTDTQGAVCVCSQGRRYTVQTATARL